MKLPKIDALEKLESRIKAKVSPAPQPSMQAQVVGMQMVVSKTLEKTNKRIESLEARQLQKGDKGNKGDRGADGKDGLNGKNGLNGKDGKDGKDGKEGKNGIDGVSVVDADIAADDHLVFTLSNGNEIDAGEIPSVSKNPLSIQTTMLGNGDVIGAASSTDNAIARFDSTTGKVIHDSGITIADGASGTLSGTNTGDQTSIVGITGTKSQFDTAVTDGDFVYAGDITASSLGLGTGDSPQFTAVNIGHATDTTVTRVSAGVIAVEGITVDTISAANTLTNKRITNRVYTTASAATVTGDWDSYDIIEITAQGEALTLANPTGTPTNGQGMLFKITDDGTSRAISYGTQFRAFGSAKATATTLGKTMYIGGIWDATDSKIDCYPAMIEV